MNSSTVLERAIIGCILVNDNCLGAALKSLGYDDFHDDDCRMIFKVMCCLDNRGRPIDRVFIMTQILLDDLNVGDYEVYKIACEAPDWSNFEHYVDELIQIRADEYLDRQKAAREKLESAGEVSNA